MEADGWGPALQSGGNQLIGLREINIKQTPPLPLQSIRLALQLPN